MEEKKQDIDINKFVSKMEHPTKEEIKKEIESSLKSSTIPDEIKNQIKSKFYEIDNNKKNFGEEYDRYVVNLLSKKRKDFKYLQAIFLIINNIEKNEILQKEGIVPENKNEEKENEDDIEINKDWYIDINIDLVFNDNNYYHKYVKKLLIELFLLLKKDFLIKYIKLDFTKKGESYYKNNKEEFLSAVISLYEKLNSVTNIVDKNDSKRKKKKKKNKKKDLASNNNNNEEEEKKENGNSIINDKNDQLPNNDSDNIINNNQNNINNLNINEIKEEKKDNNNNKIDNIIKGENIKNKIWANTNLKLNREELELVNNINNINDKPFEKEIKEINIPTKLEMPDNHLDLLSDIDINKKFLYLEKQINELKTQNKIQSNQISECQQKIVKLQKENENLKNDLNNNKIFNLLNLKKMNISILKKIIDKYTDKLNVKKEGENISINFIEDINNINKKDLNQFVNTIYLNIQDEENEEKSVFNNIIGSQFNGESFANNIVEKLFSEEEMKELNLNYFGEDNKIKNYIIEKFNLK